MKKTYMKLVPIAIAILLLTNSCTKEREEANTVISTNTPIVTDAGPVQEFSAAELYAMGDVYEAWRANLIYASAFVQHSADLTFMGGKYYHNPESAGSLFGVSYSRYEGCVDATLPKLTVVLEATKNKAAYTNLYNMARIVRVLFMHRITDMYGDVPYFEAGPKLVQLKYDQQRAIYFDMLKELEEAESALSAGVDTKIGSADLFYGGDTGKWKKLANSLMLRLGMRMSKVDPAAAESWVQKAINAGVMESNNDMARLLTTKAGAGRLNNNPNAFTLAPNGHLFFVSKTLVDYMKPRQDPRLPAYAALVDKKTGSIRDNSILNAKGLPNDLHVYDDAEIGTFSVINYSVVCAENTPYIFQNYAEVEFLLAEAAVRGWNPKGNGLNEAATHFTKGVTASIQAVAFYPNAPTITAAEITAYTSANRLNVSSTDAALEAIGNEFWIAIFLNGYEAYSNWRRTGYPKLTPVISPCGSTGGVIPRRLTYSPAEYTENAENVQAANARQGADNFLTRVWWDRP